VSSFGICRRPEIGALCGIYSLSAKGRRVARSRPWTRSPPSLRSAQPGRARGCGPRSSPSFVLRQSAVVERGDIAAPWTVRLEIRLEIGTAASVNARVFGATALTVPLACRPWLRTTLRVLRCIGAFPRETTRCTTRQFAAAAGSLGAGAFADASRLATALRDRACFCWSTPPGQQTGDGQPQAAQHPPPGCTAAESFGEAIERLPVHVIPP
jgi:hypothetical protein